jgi:hypothetical protein
MTWSGWIVNTAYNLLTLAVIGIGSLGSLLYFYQTKLIYISYLPEGFMNLLPILIKGARTSVDKPDKYGMSKFEEVYLKTPDNVKLHAYLILQESSNSAKTAPTIFVIFNHP